MLTTEFRDDCVVEWHLTDDGAEPRRNPDYAPTVYVGGDDADLRRLRDRVSPDPKVDRTAFADRYLDLHGLHAGTRERALRVDLEGVDDVQPFASEVRHHHEPRAFRPATFRLYNVDLSPGFRYCLEAEVAPSVDPPSRELRTLRLSLGAKALADGDVAELAVGEEPVAGDAATALRAVRARIDRDDPDVLILSSAELVPLLAAAADEAGIEGFQLGREPGYAKLAGANTYESYGRVGHSPARYGVPGRAIVDTSNSFLWAKSGLPGLCYLAEQSGKPLQETARGSIGNILTAIQIRAAYDREVLVPWNKWEPESFKTVETLHDADRGGQIFEPDVGLHEDVVEIDFASLYPNIMCEYNVSPETVDCDCHDRDCYDRDCDGSDRDRDCYDGDSDGSDRDRDRNDGDCDGSGGGDVPVLGYRICDRGDEKGFVPRVLRELVDDRAEFKRGRRATDDPAEAADLGAKADALKWVLVSCFGYQGYRNAKFGRIECHEAINAHAREILLDAQDRLERGGWRVLHGIVDSLWVAAREDGPQRPIDDICAAISDDVGIRLEYESDFDWLAFVPKRESGAGALNRYFGKLATGEGFKIRGIEARQRSTPSFVASVQEELIAALDGTRDVDRLCALLRRRLDDLRRGDVDPGELLVRTRVSKPAGEYSRETVAVAARRRSAERNVPRAPEQDVLFVVVDDDATGTERVRLDFERPETFDADYYADELLRAAESVLSPLGVDRREIERRLVETRNATLTSY